VEETGDLVGQAACPSYTYNNIIDSTRGGSISVPLAPAGSSLPQLFGPGSSDLGAFQILVSLLCTSFQGLSCNVKKCHLVCILRFRK
jgi:hypothetical protein